jgi:hypothetical protein
MQLMPEAFITLASLSDFTGMNIAVVSNVLIAYKNGSEGVCGRCEQKLIPRIYDGNGPRPTRIVYTAGSTATPDYEGICDACFPIVKTIRTLRASWSRCVGEHNALESQPIDVRNEALLIEAAPEIANELAFLEREIIATTNRAISDPATAITRLRFRAPPRAHMSHNDTTTAAQTNDSP